MIFKILKFFPIVFVFLNLHAQSIYVPIEIQQARNNNKSAILLTLHEVAHAYFPFMTGINERKYSWIDEGLTSYLTMETQWLMNSDYNSLTYYTATYETMSGTQADIPFSITAYQTRGYSYNFYSYFRPVMAFSVLENYMGRDTFRLAIKNFIEIWKGKHPTPFDLINVLKNTTNKEIDWIISPWFFQQGYPDMAISDVMLKDNKVQVRIEKKGIMPVPVILGLINEDGDTVLVEKNVDVWKENSSITITQTIKGKLEKIELGTQKIPDKYRKDNNFTF